MYFTETGYARLQAQLEELLCAKLPELAEQLHGAQAGGLSVDNTEYLLLRDELSFLEARIRELKGILGNAQLIQPGEANGKVQLGNTVIIQLDSAISEKYTIVGSAEADPSDGTISNLSPVGAALLDQSTGDDVDVMTPDGGLRFRILAVS
jgi:transcription elongation factor GreA